jgi:hypothetical protein
MIAAIAAFSLKAAPWFRGGHMSMVVALWSSFQAQRPAAGALKIHSYLPFGFP